MKPYKPERDLRILGEVASLISVEVKLRNRDRPAKNGGVGRHRDLVLKGLVEGRA